MAINCSLYRDKISEAINEYVKSQDGVTFELKTKTDDEDVYVLLIGKAKCYINVYYKKNGLTSISCQSSNKIGFVSPVRRYEALDRCTAVENVI